MDDNKMTMLCLTFPPSLFGCVFHSVSMLVLFSACILTLAAFTRYLGWVRAGMAFTVCSHSAE